MNKWPSKKMSEIAHLITDGKHGDCNDEDNSGYFFLSSKDLRDSKLYYDKPRQITYTDFLETHRRTNLEPGDVLLTNCGASIGRIGIAQDDPRIYKTTFQKSISVIKPNRLFVDGRYLYYFLLSNSDLLIHLGGGTAQPNLLIGDLNRIEVSIPPNIIQQRIVGILSAYDNLIENNLRRIKILEGIAQNLYTEWFVRFRFPGHDKVKMVDSTLGRIPEGWKPGKLGDVVHLVKEKYKDKYHNALPLLDLSRIPRKSLAILEFGTPDEISTSRIISEKGDILFGSIRPYFHKVVIAPCRLVTNVSVFVIRASSILQSFLVCLLFSDEIVGWASQNSGGTKMPVIKWDVFSNKGILIPPHYILEDFASKISPILDSAMTKILINKNLRCTRDLLLPKLISGEIDVSDLAIKVEEAG
jgi:type I restriction enzyme S subunit